MLSAHAACSCATPCTPASMATFRSKTTESRLSDCKEERSASAFPRSFDLAAESLIVGVKVLEPRGDSKSPPSSDEATRRPHAQKLSSRCCASFTATVAAAWAVGSHISLEVIHLRFSAWRRLLALSRAQRKDDSSRLQLRATNAGARAVAQPMNAGMSMSLKLISICG